MTTIQSKILESEIKFQYSGSSGPGGQNVNRVYTKVELRFDVNNSKSFSDEEKEILNKKLTNKISKEGILRIVCSESRSMLKNKDLCLKKFYETIDLALKKPKKRLKTSIPKRISEMRLKKKKENTEKKERRKKF